MTTRVLVRKGAWVFLIICLLMSGAVAQGEKLFSDLPDDHWAAPFIDRMSLKGIIQGYSDGTFGIQKPVSRLESVAMIIRAMGLESQAEGKNIPLTFKDPAPVPQWGQKYVAMGVMQGVISGNDLLYFRADDPAKRFEVAQFIGKAMGWESIAPSHVSDPLSYTDAAQIPLSARGYVVLLKEKGIMAGNADGSFRPQEQVTRAEFATLMARLDACLQKNTTKEVRGTISQITGNTIKINTGSGSVSLLIGDNARIYFNGKTTSLNALLPGDPVLVIKNAGGQAALIEAEIKSGSSDSGLSESKTGKVSGVLVSVNYSPQPGVTVKIKESSGKTFILDNGCDIERDGNNASLQDLLPGDEVSLSIVNDKVVELEAVPTTGKAEGTVKQIMITDQVELTVTLADGVEKTFIINSSTRIKRDGETFSLVDLRAGDRVELRLESSVVTRMYVESSQVKDQITGTVNFLNPDLNLLVVAVEDGDKKENYTVLAGDNTNIVTADGRVTSRLSKITEGDRVIVVGDSRDHVLEAATILIINR